MLLATFAVALGLAAGLLFRSRYRHLAPPRLRGWLLLIAGLAAQLAADLVAGPVLVTLSYALLLAFAARNLHLVGMPIVVLGLTLNTIVIGLNGGMPVRAEALEAAGIVDDAEMTTVDLGPKRHLEDPDDRLTILGDAVPLPPLDRVVSFGDLVLYVGLADVVAHVVRRRRRSGAEDSWAGWTEADDDAVSRLLAREDARRARAAL